MSGTAYFRMISILTNLTWLVVAVTSLQALAHEENTEVRFRTYDVEGGLSQSVVNDVVQDGDGFLWIATQDGLNRFDGYEFKVFKHRSNKPDSLAENYINALFPDRLGRLWVATNSMGVDRYDPRTNIFTHFPEIGRDEGNGAEQITDISEWAGLLWFAGSGGSLYRFDPVDETVERMKSRVPASINRLLGSDEGFLWVAADKGLFRYFAKTDRIEQMEGSDGITFHDVRTDPLGHILLGSDHGLLTCEDERDTRLRKLETEVDEEEIRTIWFEDEHRVWLGTDVSGLLLVDSENWSVLRRFQPRENQSGGIREKRITRLFGDRDDILWIGTFGSGVYSFVRPAVAHYGVHSPKGLKHHNVTSLFRSPAYLYLGTDNGLEQWREDDEGGFAPVASRSMPEASAVWSVFSDEEHLYLGTGGEGLIVLEKGIDGPLTQYRHDPKRPISLASDLVFTIRRDYRDNFLIGTMNGLSVMASDKPGRFQNYAANPVNPKALGHGRLTVIYQDQLDRIWMGTGGGLHLADYDDDGHLSFKRWHHQRDRPDSLSHDSVVTIVQDPHLGAGILWVGTYGGGLDRMDVANSTFRVFQQEDGLPGDAVCGVVVDDRKNLWVSTNEGLARFDSVKERFYPLTLTDGLQSREFNVASAASFHGRLYFGGINGFNTFHREDLARETRPPHTVLTKFLLFNKEVENRPTDPDALLKQTVAFTDALTLNYRDYVFSLEFAGLHLEDPQHHRYAYRLEGLDKDWIYTDASQRYAPYANVSPGNYIFRVKSGNKHGVWEEEGVRLPIRIEPSPLASPLAYFLYVLLLLLVVVSYLRYHRRSLMREREHNDQLRELDKLKDEFLANTSHELRTPLNGIVGLTESLLDGDSGSLPEDARENLRLITHGALRLTKLINDILDYSKLKNKRLILHREPINLHTLTQNMVIANAPKLGKKDVTILSEVPQEFPMIFADEGRLRQIMGHLIDNAIKFTEKGLIQIQAEIRGQSAEISVKDTGIGIDSELQGRIFHSFEQLEGSIERTYGGAGLGLAVTRQLVMLHGGHLSLVSQPGSGSTFTFSMPLWHGEREQVPRRQSRDIRHEEPLAASPEVGTSTVTGVGEFTILIVDDEPVNRKVLLNHLKHLGFRLIPVASGKEALRVLMEEPRIDLVLLDIMMPQMSGYEVCRCIREVAPIQDLPVIFLSARNQPEDIAAGFEVEGNDYLTKPISRIELLARVEMHLNMLTVNRNMIRAREEIEDGHRRLIMQEKMASLGVLVAGAAHELNNPLNFIHASAQNMEVDLKRFKAFLLEIANENAEEEITALFGEKMAALQQHARTILKGTYRIEAIVKDLQAFSPEHGGIEQSIIFAEHMNTTIKLVQAMYKSIEFKQEIQDSLPMRCKPAELCQMLLLLLRNAAEAVERKHGRGRRGGEIVIKTSKEANWAVLQIEDNGIGIPKEMMDRIFEPFFTTKKLGDGPGLGLSTAYGIVLNHGGNIAVKSEERKGTKVTVKIPFVTTDDYSQPMGRNLPRKEDL